MGGWGLSGKAALAQASLPQGGRQATPRTARLTDPLAPVSHSPRERAMSSRSHGSMDLASEQPMFVPLPSASCRLGRLWADLGASPPIAPVETLSKTTEALAGEQLGADLQEGRGKKPDVAFTPALPALPAHVRSQAHWWTRPVVGTSEKGSAPDDLGGVGGAPRSGPTSGRSADSSTK